MSTEIEKLRALNHYHKNNKSKKSEYDRKRYEEKQEENKSRNKKYREDNPDKIKQYYKDNKSELVKYHREYRKNRINTDPVFKLKVNIRSSIGLSFRNKGYSKKSKTYDILGCTFEEFKLHLESQFADWMSWDNQGLYNGELCYGWDIDHIIPVSSAITEEDVIRLNHYTNLQPLCSKVNRDIKKNKCV